MVEVLDMCAHITLSRNMMACELSAKVSNREMFQAKLLTSSSRLGQQEHKSSTSHTSHNGLTFIVNGRVIHMTHL